VQLVCGALTFKKKKCSLRKSPAHRPSHLRLRFSVLAPGQLIYSSSPPGPLSFVLHPHHCHAPSSLPSPLPQPAIIVPMARPSSHSSEPPHAQVFCVADTCACRSCYHSDGLVCSMPTHHQDCLICHCAALLLPSTTRPQRPFYSVRYTSTAGFVVSTDLRHYTPSTLRRDWLEQKNASGFEIPRSRTHYLPFGQA